MYEHELRFTHRRRSILRTYDTAPTESEVEIDASSMDLTEAWKELLSRLPNDVFAGLKAAMSAALDGPLHERR